MKYLSLIFLSLFLAFPAAAKQADTLVRQVENKKVCMVNDTFFGREQIPVSVGTKTYFGCCENCKETLKNKTAARYSTDPVTGKKVDKASAIIGALTDGKVLYFESIANLEKFNKRPRKAKR